MKKKLSPAEVKYSRPPISAKASRKYDAMMKKAFERLDSDDYDGFWAHIEDMNDIAREARDA